MHTRELREVLQTQVQGFGKTLRLNHRLVRSTKLFGKSHKTGSDSSHKISGDLNLH